MLWMQCPEELNNLWKASWQTQSQKWLWMAQIHSWFVGEPRPLIPSCLPPPAHLLALGRREGLLGLDRWPGNPMVADVPAHKRPSCSEGCREAWGWATWPLCWPHLQASIILGKCVINSFADLCWVCFVTECSHSRVLRSSQTPNFLEHALS
jgi:hypothetical protein